MKLRWVLVAGSLLASTFWFSQKWNKVDLETFVPVSKSLQRLVWKHGRLPPSTLLKAWFQHKESSSISFSHSLHCPTNPYFTQVAMNYPHLHRSSGPNVVCGHYEDPARRFFLARCCPGGAPFSQRSELATACTNRMQIKN